MSSWFSDLAGKAETILNKIDQNAANVLKNDLSDCDQQLIEVKTDMDDDNRTMAKQTKMAKRNTMLNSMKLTSKSPKKALSISTERIPQIDIIDESKADSKLLSVNADDGGKSQLPSTASNSSRRSSCSSRTEGIQTVIEYPITKVSTQSNTTSSDMVMQTSTSSLGSLQSSLTDDKTEMMASKIVIAQMKAERDQMRTDIDELKSQLAIAKKEDILSELTATCDQLAIDKENLQRKLSDIDDSNNGYVKTISQLQVSIAKMHETQMDVSEKLAMAKTETEQACFELQQYRSRAQHTLQMKDELIAELKSMHAKDQSADIDTDIDAQCKQIEYVTLKQERDSFLDEINMLRNQLNTNKQIITSLESKLQEIEQQYSESEKSLTSALKQEKLKYSQFEETTRIQAKELKAVRDELKRQQSLTSVKLHEQYERVFPIICVSFRKCSFLIVFLLFISHRETELARLRAKLSQQQSASHASIASNNTDDRVYSLTQSLVQKQNALESITADRNAIRIQLEKLESQHRETMQLLRHQRMPQIINVNDTDDAKSQVPSFMRETIHDTRVARRMKRAYSTLDSAGVRLGVFMRRYPLVRTMAIVYVAVLHLWVIFVLLSFLTLQ